MTQETKSGLYSHPDVFIEDHINRCLELAHFFLNQKLPFLTEEIYKAILIAIALHDFGKTTSYFQDYIKGTKSEKSRLATHSFISGVYAYYVSKKFLKNEILPFFLYVICKRHHSNLDGFVLEAESVINKEEFILKQLEAIDEEKCNIFIKNLNLPEEIKKGLFFSKKEFAEALEDTIKEIKKFRKSFRKKQSIKNYLLFQYIFSLVLDADKTEAGAKPFTPKRYDHIPFEVIEEYKKKNFKLSTKSKSVNLLEKINQLRERAFKEVMSKELNLAQKIYSLTLPTGMGKTLTGFAFALRLRETIKKVKGYTPRIIYSLPFLSIIDQNAEVLKSILETRFKVTSSLLLKHHHLSEKTYEEYEFSISRVLTEGWNSEVVITTFVQLFETLFSWRNQNSRRFNKLAGSIILIDEVQALPSKYWHLLRDVLTELSEEMETYIIFMTATQPYLIKSVEELVNKNFYFSQLNRISFFVDVIEEKTIENFISQLKLKQDKTYLFIANTVSSAKALYEGIKKLTNEKICYLSTHIIPFERKQRIKAIKDKTFRIAVTTQLVEAGVDIDFDVVYRDLAPLDSLSQSAGRCNRNMTADKGEIKIITLANEKKRPFCSYIYDPVLIDGSKSILKDCQNPISEPEFISLVEEYFKEVWKRISPDISNRIKNALQTFSFSGEKGVDKLHIKDFKLIEEEVYKSDVFIEIDEEAQKVWKEAKEIIRKLKQKKLSLFEAKEAFEKIKPQFYQYVISVPVKDNTPEPDEELNIYYVPYETLETFYDPETGFKMKGDLYL